MLKEELLTRIVLADQATLARVAQALEGDRGGNRSVALLTLSDAAKTLRVSRSTAYRMIEDGALKTVEIRPGCRRVPEAELVRLATHGAVPA